MTPTTPSTSPSRPATSTRRRTFYVDGLGCHLARRYEDRITLDFFGDQVVCHLSEHWDREARRPLPPPLRGHLPPPPGLRRPRAAGRGPRALAFYSPVQPRFEGKVEEHLTFVLRDPSNNLSEFKHYRDPRMMY